MRRRDGMLVVPRPLTARDTAFRDTPDNFASSPPDTQRAAISSLKLQRASVGTGLRLRLQGSSTMRSTVGAVVAIAACSFHAVGYKQSSSTGEVDPGAPLRMDER